MPAGFVKTRLVKRETGVIPVRSRHCDKGVQILFRMESHWCMALGRQNLYEDLSARKPANRLVQGNEFPDHE